MSDAARARPAPRALLAHAYDAIEAHPGRAFATFAALHAAVWTLVPGLVFGNLTLDVTEAVAYGQEWLLLYWKHPGLPWWLVDIVHRLAGARLWAYFLLGQLAVVTCMWAVWRLGCEILRPIDSLVAVIILSGCLAFNFRGIELNHNTMQLPIWGLAAWSLYRAFVGKRMLDWVLVGLWFGLAFYAKFAAVTLIAPLLLFSIIDRDARASWRGAGPYVAMVVCAILLAPQAVAMVAGTYNPIGFATATAQAPPGVAQFALHSVMFVVGQLLVIAACLAMFAALVGKPANLGRGAAPPDAFARRYVTVLALGPVVTLMAIGLVSWRQFHPDWALQHWSFVSLFLLVWWRPPIDRAALARLGGAWAASTAIIAGGLVAAEMFHVGGGQRWRSQFPGEQFTSALTESWRRETGQRLAYVVGHFWLSGNVILYATDPPRLYHEANPRHSPWIDEADLRRRGAVFLWDGDPVDRVPEEFRARFPEAELREPIVVRRMTMRGERQWRVNWAILRPAAP